jgi:hypothetical protein
MKPVQWIVATAIASVMMISYVHGFVFPRTEGQRLEKQMDMLYPILNQIQKDLGRIEGKIDQHFKQDKLHASIHR